MESVMVEVAHLNSMGQHFTAAIKNSTGFELIILAVHFIANE
jgi:hypothetical protein